MGYMTGEGVWSVELVFALAGQLLLEQFPDVAYMSSASADKLPLHAGLSDLRQKEEAFRPRASFASEHQRAPMSARRGSSARAATALRGLCRGRVYLRGGAGRLWLAAGACGALVLA